MLNVRKSSDDKVDTLLARGLVPIIDLAHCGTEECPVKSVVNRVGLQLQKALSEKGMALLVNHGIADEKLKTAWDHLDDFVELSEDVKEHYIRTPKDNHGYVSPGLERFDGKTPELRHAFNISTLNAKNLPEEPLPGFAEHISTLAKDFKSLASFILQSLAVSLDIPQSFFTEKHSHMLSGDHDNETTLRLLYYPPIIEDDEKNEYIRGHCKYSYQRCLSDQPDFRPEHNPRDDELNETDNTNGSDQAKSTERQLANGSVIRCGAHTDYGTFTLLAQDSEGGLEVKLPGSEKWHRVGHLPGAILVNCGEILSIWTQERYPALQHRVVIPEQEHIRSRGRHSIAFFCHPDNLTMISPNDLPLPEVQDTTCKKGRKKSFKAAKDKVYNAYQLIQKRFRDTYNNSQ
ncbi:1-aminocyclopropane-1-carboxylate oxidase-like [Teleopsis dalmanni]|uniref:1-aminocyclopropane-1-carboxylate oxidase-like n=1 Tax=Teleopsis dalmanni TaxID=139649 RepID=UPI0018CDF620|nr:1-aminocyclopropane-1-carboxylate oxidase-like [Teleopsis dalmanni]